LGPAKNPRPADRRPSAELVVRVAPDHEPVVRRFGGDLMVSLARPDGPTGWREARRRRAPCGGATVGHPALLGIGRALAAAERDENEYGEPLNETG
jgi:hypothetical protein